jgi:cytochrome c5
MWGSSFHETRRALVIDAAATAATYAAESARSPARARPEKGAAARPAASPRARAGGANWRGRICRGCFWRTRTFQNPYWKYWRAREASELRL